MKKIKFLLSISIAVAFLIAGCSNENNMPPEDGRLSAPNGLYLAKSMDDLKLNLANKIEGVTIDQVYFVDENVGSNQLFSMISYSVDNLQHKTMVLRNFEKIKFQQGAIIKYSQSKDAQNRGNGEGDIYISCEGAGCCYPEGSINMETGEIVTACNCEGNPSQNSSCIMKVSTTIPGSGN